jgi:hypothetical protein
MKVKKIFEFKESLSFKDQEDPKKYGWKFQVEQEYIFGNEKEKNKRYNYFKDEETAKEYCDKHDIDYSKIQKIKD